MPIVVKKREQTKLEESFNGFSHSVGLLAAILATPFMILESIRIGDAGFIVGASIFCSTVVLLYLTSTIYHFLNQGKTKRVFRVLDHCVIFLLIAGSYTPFTLGVFRGALGWSFFGVIWGIALIGIILKAVSRLRHSIISTALYLLMGWIIIFAIEPLVTLVPPSGVAWLAAGGVFYTVGVLFFALDAQIRFSHFVWHLFVMAGTVCHYIAIYRYAA